MKTFRELLIEFRACSDAMEFVGDKTVEEALRDCKRGDWILWLAIEIGTYWTDAFYEYNETYGHCMDEYYNETFYIIDSSKEVRDIIGDEIITKVNKLLNNE